MDQSLDEIIRILREAAAAWFNNQELLYLEHLITLARQADANSGRAP